MLASGGPIVHPWSERCCKSNVGKVVDFNLVFYAHFDGRWLPGVLRRVAGWLWHGKTRSSAVADATPPRAYPCPGGFSAHPKPAQSRDPGVGGRAAAGFAGVEVSRGRGESSCSAPRTA